MTVGSFVNRRMASPERTKRIPAAIPVMASVRRMVSQMARRARSSCLAPMFWLTKEVEAIAMLCMGSTIN